MRALVLVVCIVLWRISPASCTGCKSVDTFDFENFRGGGFNSGGVGGALDSMLFRAFGLSEGEGTFGQEHLSGDFARGIATGPVSIGGVYAFDLGGADSDWAIGLQPTSSDLSPGGIEFRWTNQGRAAVESIQIGYELLVRNNGGRASTLSVYLQASSGPSPQQGNAPPSSLSSPGPPDTIQEWIGLPVSAVIQGLSVLPGEHLIVGWLVDDAGGTGARDEFALDDLQVRVLRQVDEPHSLGLLALAGCGILPWLRARRQRVTQGDHNREDRAADFDAATRCRRRHPHLRQSGYYGTAAHRWSGRLPAD